jgi:hypothetical protein
MEIFNYGCLVTAAFGQTRHSILGAGVQNFMQFGGTAQFHATVHDDPWPVF